MFWSKTLVERQFLRRFHVTLTGNEGVFAGVLTASDEFTHVFEDCRTDNGDQIAGRVFVDRVQVAYMQAVG